MGRVCTDLVVPERVKIDAFLFFSGPNAWHASRISAAMYSVNSASTFHGKFLSRPLHFMAKISQRQFPQREGIAPYSAQNTAGYSGTVGAYCHVLPAAVYNTLAFTCTVSPFTALTTWRILVSSIPLCL